MSRYDFFPYEARSDALNMTMKIVSGDAVQEGKDQITVPEACSSDVRIRFGIIVPPDVRAAVFASSEQQKPPAAVYVIIQALSSRRRLSVEAKGGKGLYRTDFSFNRSDWFGDVNCRAVLVRTSTDLTVPLDFAADKGSQLAWSSDARISFDEASAQRGKNLSIQWVDFSKSEKQWLRDHADDIFCISYQSPPPAIYLNSCIPNLQTILENRATHGAKAAVRDAVFAQITHQVWTSILADALDEAARGSDNGPTLENLAGWQQDVISGWAPYLIPELDKEEAIDEIVRRLSDTGWPDELLGERLPNAIQSRLNTVNYFRALCREIA